MGSVKGTQEGYVLCTVLMLISLLMGSGTTDHASTKIDSTRLSNGWWKVATVPLKFKTLLELCARTFVYFAHFVETIFPFRL